MTVASTNKMPREKSTATTILIASYGTCSPRATKIGLSHSCPACRAAAAMRWYRSSPTQADTDFGRSLRDSTALSFKLGWGATTEPQPMYVRAVRGATPRFDVAAPGIRFLTGLWRSLPRNLADALGPAVCRRWLA